MTKPTFHIVGSTDTRETVTVKNLPGYPKEVWVTMYKSLPTGEKRKIMNSHPDRNKNEDKLTDAAIAMLVPLIKEWSFGEEVEVDDGNGGKKKEAQMMEVSEENLDKLDSDAVALLVLVGSGQVEVKKDGTWEVKKAEKKSENQ